MWEVKLTAEGGKGLVHVSLSLSLQQVHASMILSGIDTYEFARYTYLINTIANTFSVFAKPLNVL